MLLLVFLVVVVVCLCVCVGCVGRSPGAVSSGICTAGVLPSAGGHAIVSGNEDADDGRDCAAAAEACKGSSTLTRSLTIHSLTHLLHSFTHSLAHHPFIHSLSRHSSFITHSFTIHSLTRSPFIHSPTRSPFIHSLAHQSHSLAHHSVIHSPFSHVIHSHAWCMVVRHN
ncbi:MAG TPA: hypothetical protein V6C97_00630 [Oculatellaceae cyanobacterium]